MYYVYVLHCGDGNLYTGYSADLKARLKCHHDGRVLSTKGRRPVELVFYEAFAVKSDAIRREGYLKTTAGKRAIKLMLREWFKAKDGGTPSVAEDSPNTD
ncbi:MAG: GIY-YIG nuclease family protein [Candidatus Brocadiia bacterium]